MGSLRADLAAAERHVAEGEARLAAQADLVARLAAQCHDTGLAEALLDAMRVTLDAHRDHRDLILREIEGELPARPDA